MKNARGHRACVDLAEEVGFRVRSAAAPPPSQARSGEFLKTLHWSVFALRAGISTSSVQILLTEMKNARGYRACIDLAEEVGFEPTEPCGSTVFKTAAFNHSAIPPVRPDYIRCLIGAAPSVGILQVSFVRASRWCLVLRPSRSFQPLSKRKLPIHSGSICPFGKFCFTRLKFVVSCKMRI